MKKFLIKFLIYLSPLPIYLGIIWLIDPYNFTGKNIIISKEVRTEVSDKINPFIWKLIEFNNKKTTRIILGDSRAAKIREDLIKNRTGLDYYNFAYPGGTLTDMIETFWYVDSKVDLKEVYMGINFNLYNDFEKKNNVIMANEIVRNFFSYSFSKVVVNSAIKCVIKEYFNEGMTIGKPSMDQDEFWKYEIEVIGKRFYQKYSYPHELHAELLRISNYCKNKNIKLIFFMPPNHVDWQNRPIDFKLEKEKDTFVEDIRQIGTLYNMDVENDYTTDRKNFRDPMHCINDSLLINTIWSN